MIYRLVAIIWLVQFPSICTQAQSSFFNNTYDIEQWDFAASVLQTDNGYLVLGTAMSTQAAMIELIQLDSLGDTVWTKIYNLFPRSMYPGAGNSLIKTVDGGFAFCGSIVDSGGTGLDDLLFMKFDSIGDTMWTRTYGGLAQDLGRDCRHTEDGGYILIGTTGSFGNGSGDIYLVKTNFLGDTLWTNTYGGSGLETGFGVDITYDGGYLLSGYTESFGQGTYVVKVDSLGIQQWQRTIATNDPGQGGVAFQSTDSCYIVYSAKADSNGNNKDGLILKLSETGDSVLWARTYAGTIWDDWFEQAIELPDGSIVATGSSKTDQFVRCGWLVKVAADGDSIWSRKYSVPDSITNQFGSISSTFDDGFVMSGWAGTPTQDTWVVKTNCFGFDALPQAVSSFTVDTLTASFLNQSERAGTYLWNFGDGNSSTDANPSHTYPDSGTYIVSLTAAACGDTSISVDTVIVSIPVGIHPQISDRDIRLSLAPNPFKESTTITYQLPFSTEYGEIAIYNTVGHVIAGFKVIGSGQLEFSNSNLSPGIYVCNYIHGNRVVKSVKMVIIK